MRSSGAFLLIAALLAGCGDGGNGTAAAATAAIDPARIPSGDGKITTSAAAGYIFSCTTTFGGRGASAAGPWINSDGTWNAGQKIAVQGSVAWPEAEYSVDIVNATRTISTNDLPDHHTGTFPIAASDPAYAYDRNPGSIGARTLVYHVPRVPAVNASPTCLGLGTIGIMLTGTALFNALDAEGRDAVEHELQDSCHGHPAGPLITITTSRRASPIPAPATPHFSAMLATGSASTAIAVRTVPRSRMRTSTYATVTPTRSFGMASC
ncbi:MAG TPA: hypothetical protein VIK27_01135 [Candidatus Aquilonibacter sp.]